MRKVANVVLSCIAVLCRTAFAQSAPAPHANLVTVCELLRNAHKYEGKNLAVLGRLDCGHSLIDNPCYLAEDKCSSIAIIPWEIGLPKPPELFPQIAPANLKKKLSRIRNTTKLGTHREPQFRMDADKHALTFSGFANTKDAWAIAYGQVVSIPKYGGANDPPLALIIGPDVRELND